MTTQSLLRLVKFYEVDEFGVKNYNTNYLAAVTLITLYGIIAAFSMVLVRFEQASATSNIETYGDAFWVLMLSASTIGFEDFSLSRLVGGWSWRSSSISGWAWWDLLERKLSRNS